MEKNMHTGIHSSWACLVAFTVYCVMISMCAEAVLMLAACKFEMQWDFVSLRLTGLYTDNYKNTWGLMRVLPIPFHLYLYRRQPWHGTQLQRHRDCRLRRFLDNELSVWRWWDGEKETEGRVMGAQVEECVWECVCVCEGLCVYMVIVCAWGHKSVCVHLCAFLCVLSPG